MSGDKQQACLGMLYQFMAKHLLGTGIGGHLSKIGETGNMKGRSCLSNFIP
jgi:hypothetical protein